MGRLVTGIIVMIMTVSVAAVYGSGLSGQNDVFPIPGQYIVRFADDAALTTVSNGFGLFRLGVPSVEKVFDDFEAREVRPIFPASAGKASDLSRYYLVKIGENRDEKRFIEALSANPNILSIEQDLMCRVYGESDDPGRINQWWVYQSSRVDIHAQEAWELETGSDTVIIAIIDSGVNYNHSDLKNNIWINPGEDIDGDMVVFDSTDFNNIDNDGNGYADDVVGYDFFSGGSATPWPGEDGGVPDRDPNDFNGHGTHCAGIAAAVTNNGVGGAGTCGGWGNLYSERGAQIMCLRAGYSAVDPDDGHEVGLLVMSAVAEAINYAVDNGAAIINYSAGSSFTSALFSAMNRAMDSGLVFANAAGNDGADTPAYLATFAGVLAVANTDADDKKFGSSNFGTWIDVAAPGSEIYSTYSSHYVATYDYLWGTSMASPVVAGVAALIKSHYPQYDKTVIDTLIVNRADSINDPYFLSGQLGGGRVNAYNCLADWPAARFSASTRFGAPPLTVDFADLSIEATSWSWDFGDGGSSLDQNPSHEYASPGYYTVMLTIDGLLGTHTEVKKKYVYVSADTLSGDPIFGKVNQPLIVTVNLANNTPIDNFVLPLKYPGSGVPRLAYDSFTVAGTRTADFDYITRAAQSLDMVVFLFKAALTSGKDALQAGDGPILTVYFTPIGTGTFAVETAPFGTQYELECNNRFSHFRPTVEPIQVLISAYNRGDANGDGDINLGDAVYIINFAFRSGLPPIDYPMVYAADANADLSINVGDAVYIISYAFRGGPPPPP